MNIKSSTLTVYILELTEQDANAFLVDPARAQAVPQVRPDDDGAGDDEAPGEMHWGEHPSLTGLIGRKL